VPASLWFFICRFFVLYFWLSKGMDACHGHGLPWIRHRRWGEGQILHDPVSHITLMFLSLSLHFKLFFNFPWWSNHTPWTPLVTLPSWVVSCLQIRAANDDDDNNDDDDDNNNNNNNNNNRDDIYGAFIVAKPLRQFTRFIWWMQTQRRGGHQPSDQTNRFWLKQNNGSYRQHLPSPFYYYSARELILILPSHGGWKTESI